MAQETPDTTGRKKASSTGAGCYRILIGPPADAGALETLLQDTVSGIPDRKVLVIEADPDRAAKLETQLPNAQVMAAVVGEKAGEAELVQYNFPGLAGITPPLPALGEILPGLRAVAHKQTTVIGVDAVTKWLGKRGAAGPLDLYVDAPGSEEIILDGIAVAGLFAVCARLRLRCGAEPMFEQAAGRDALVTRAQAEGLKLVHEDTEDPDFPELVFEVDLVARALEEAQSDLAKLKRKGTSDKAQITKLKKEHAAAVTQLGKDHAAALAQLEKDHAATAAQLGAAQAATTARLKKEQADTVAELEKATKAKAAVEDEKTAAQAQIAALTEEVGTLQAEVAEEQKNTRQVREALHKRNGEIEARGKAAEEARIAHEAALADLQAQQENAAQEQKAASDEEIATLTAQIETLRGEVEEEQKNTRQIREMLHKRNGELEARSKAMEDARVAHETALGGLEAELEKARVEMKTTRENLVQLRDRLNKRNEAFEAQAQELKRRDQELEAQGQELQARTEELETAGEALEAARVQAEDQAEAHAQELAEQLQEHARALKSAKKKLSKRDTKLKAHTAQSAEVTAQIEALEAQVNSLEAAQKTGQQNLAQAREMLNKRTKELETARAETAERAPASAPEPDADTLAQLEQSKADLAVALRMQMLAQSDLRDLQARFREVSQARTAQQELLEKLTPRLQQAASQLQHMHLIDAEPQADVARLEGAQAVADVLEDAAPEAQSASKGSSKKAKKSGSKSKSKSSSKRAPRTSKAAKS